MQNEEFRWCITKTNQHPVLWGFHADLISTVCCRTSASGMCWRRPAARNIFCCPLVCCCPLKHTKREETWVQAQVSRSQVRTITVNAWKGRVRLWRLSCNVEYTAHHLKYTHSYLPIVMTCASYRTHSSSCAHQCQYWNGISDSPLRNITVGTAITTTTTATPKTPSSTFATATCPGWEWQRSRPHTPTQTGMWARTSRNKPLFSARNRSA